MSVWSVHCRDRLITPCLACRPVSGGVATPLKTDHHSETIIVSGKSPEQDLHIVSRGFMFF